MTVDFTLAQNIPERANRNICDGARSMIMEAVLSKRFWAVAGCEHKSASS
jgi:hypothetical protein